MAPKTKTNTQDETAAPTQADAPEHAERTLTARLRDSAYASVGAADTTVRKARQFREAARTTPGAVRKSLSELRPAPGAVRKSLGDPKELNARFESLLKSATAEFETLVGRGRQVVQDVSHNPSVEQALSQTQTARRQVKAAATTILKAAGSSAKTAEDAASSAVEPAEEAAVPGDAAEAPDAPAEPDYSRMTVAELRALARQRGIEGRNEMNKAELVETLSKA